MNIADYVILGTIAVSMLFSLLRGFTVEALSLATWIAALIIARLFSWPLAELLPDYIDPPSLRQPAAFAALFILTLLVGSLVRHVIKGLVNATGLSATDRFLGTAFGAVRGALFVVVALAVLIRFTQAAGDPWWQQSLLIPHFLMVEGWTADLGANFWNRLMEVGS